ncbi:glucuronate isomerase [Polaribacter vadi]|uniref:Uronate isomerase n=1 Tax=Polaribacter vadi TaxID=1774273 RepID=A0A1B8TR60_9FLAO|nr:glucuronate isomerase [Polaribacter vadi]AOW18518.1 glucuronate isomerase [Polaribacter vadi]OBY62121.1 glucuronate isomerase [Polaribacter vadi]
MKIKPFLNDDFLLENSISQQLYHDYAKKQPIIDYHSHVSDADIANNRKYENLTQAWLESDSSKWRAMRTFGISEKYITGEASDFEKFEKWAKTVPFTIRNPLYHWTQMELKIFLSEERLLNSNNAEIIFNETAAKLSTNNLAARNILKNANVEVAVTTDDPSSDLKNHQKIKNDDCSFKLLPTFRPDNSIHIEKTSFVNYITQLSEAKNTSILNFSDLLNTLKNCIDYFHENGCRISDHGLEHCYVNKLSFSISDKTFKKRISGEKISKEEIEIYKSTLLFELGKMYASKNWVMQLHLGAMRNTNSRLFKLLGNDAGSDSIGDFNQGLSLSVFLNRLDKEGKLPKTIIYNLNPRDNELIASMVGNFNDGSIKGKVQFGAAWWFMDQKDGIEKQLNTLSNVGLLSCFVGMLSDSRSLFSYARHDYFRRILCNLIGKDVYNGELPNDISFLGDIVNDVSYFNAKNYFNF